MDLLNNLYFEIKPIFHTFTFEIRLQLKKFVIFSGISILILFLDQFIRTIQTQFLDDQFYFYKYGLGPFTLIISFAVSFLFGGIICSEFKNKTGLEIIPLIHRYKLILGKYLANSLLVIGIISVYYLTMALFAYYFFAGPLLKTLLYSFSFAVLYALALGSIATFLSSFLRSIIPIILIIVGYTFIGDLIITSIIRGINNQLEPLFSFDYLFNIVENILYPNFTQWNRLSPSGIWMFPSIEGALIILSLYIVSFLVLSILLFKRREF
ncbi:MAG: ABC transporter permease [Promethearchaeota archaeon]